MLDLIELLESLNRKERFFLISQALGNFQLSDSFRQELGKTIQLSIPAGSFTAMDYHLDWLTAALYAYERGDAEKPFDNPKPKIVRGTQEDIDLLIAFRDSERYHIVLVEAKGATGWTNRQMRSKADRLSEIFGSEGNRYPGVQPHICLMSSRRPSQRLETRNWPAWMRKDDWLALDFPKDRKKVTRCDVGGEPSVDGTHFCIEPAR